VLALRKSWHPESAYPAVYADPSTGAKIGVGNMLGDPASVQTEYAEHGISLSAGNNDRIAGYSRLLELLHVKPRRLPPTWADVPEDVGGAPRLYVFRSCRNLIGQLQSAPIATEGIGAGVMVEPKWESAHGLATASARYGAMSWQPPTESTESARRLDDPRAEALRQSYIREREEAELRQLDALEYGL
jgi:hypothetical protein